MNDFKMTIPVRIDGFLKIIQKTLFMVWWFKVIEKYNDENGLLLFRSTTVFLLI